jgi:Lar family restriction alleviation protein
MDEHHAAQLSRLDLAAALGNLPPLPDPGPSAPTEGLLPCPFCGHVLVVYVAGIPPVVFVQCGCCGASGPDGSRRTAAIAAWNRRSETPDVAALKQQLHRTIEAWANRDGRAVDLADLIRRWLHGEEALIDQIAVAAGDILGGPLEAMGGRAAVGGAVDVERLVEQMEEIVLDTAKPAWDVDDATWPARWYLTGIFSQATREQIATLILDATTTRPEAAAADESEARDDH